MDSILQDFRYALRMLTKSPGFTAVAVLTLALGIGANTVVFGMVNSVLMRPLPFDRPEQLVKIWGRYSKQDIPQNWISEPEVWDLRDALGSVSNLAAYTTGNGANLTRDASEPLRVTTSQASAELLPMLGVKPALGRLFNADEDKPGRERVALLTFGFWKTQMAADAAVVGRDIQLNGQAYTVVGVLPDGFTFGGDADMWLPLALDRARPNNRGNHYLEVLARLKAGRDAAAGVSGPRHRRAQSVRAVRAVLPEGQRLRPVPAAAADRPRRRRQARAGGGIRRGRLRAVDRVHQPRKPAPGTRLVARPRTGGPRRARRRPAAARTADGHRGHRPLRRRRRMRRHSRVVGDGGAENDGRRRAAEHAADRRGRAGLVVCVQPRRSRRASCSDSCQRSNRRAVAGSMR